MRLENLELLVAVVLAGSLALERIVTTAKTIGPTMFGEPGVGSSSTFGVLEDERIERHVGRIWTKEQWRRVKVLMLVYAASFTTAWLVAEPLPTGSCWIDLSAVCRGVTYGAELFLPWWLFAILISSGSALWANVVGYVSALKDVKAEERQAVRDSPAAGATVLVVNPADRPGLGMHEPSRRPEPAS